VSLAEAGADGGERQYGFFHRNTCVHFFHFLSFSSDYRYLFKQEAAIPGFKQRLLLLLQISSCIARYSAGAGKSSPLMPSRWEMASKKTGEIFEMSGSGATPACRKPRKD
jgi:hypothetical protein